MTQKDQRIANTSRKQEIQAKNQNSESSCKIDF